MYEMTSQYAEPSEVSSHLGSNAKNTESRTFRVRHFESIDPVITECAELVDNSNCRENRWAVVCEVKAATHIGELHRVSKKHAKLFLL